MKETDWIYIADEASIPCGEGRRVTCQGSEIALFHDLEKWFATDNACPHRQGSLADGIIAGKAVFCPLHNWKISLETGRASSGGEGCVKTYPVKVTEGRIYISMRGS